MTYIQKVVVVVALALGCFPLTLNAQTYIETTEISEDTVWVKDGSPYVLRSSLTVNEGATLRIDPGVVVKFDLGRVHIVVLGNLMAEGTVDDPIHFTSLYNNAIGGITSGDEYANPHDFLEASNWGIQLASVAERSVISHATFSYAGGSGNSIVVLSPQGAELKNISMDTVNQGLVSVKGDLDIHNVQISNTKRGGFMFFGSTTAHISSTTLSNIRADDAIGIYENASAEIQNVVVEGSGKAAVGIYGDGEVNISNSAFKGNAIGVEVYPYQNGNEPRVSISESVIEDNQTGVINHSLSNITMTHNWWGSILGPVAKDNLFGKGNMVTGNVEYRPWLERDPFEEKMTCCSNVAFIPGLQASRLYKTTDGIFGPSTNRLWEPNRRDDVRALYMDEGGKSIDSSIFVDGVIDRAYEPVGIGVYDTFIDTLDTLVQFNDINGWKMFPYDWRVDYGQIISDYDLQDEIEKLAATSDTGKVTIVAHSNGGLLTKALMLQLESKNMHHLVDKVIMVAVPQLGTPSAVAALLHGEDTSIAGGSFMSRDIGRKLGENMPSAYNLLPSSGYIESGVEPTIKFSDTLVGFNKFYDYYGDSIDTTREMRHFLLGFEGREKPNELVLNEPNILNSWLYASSTTTHGILDQWTPTENIHLIQIAGWGAATLDGMKYEATEICKPLAHGVDCSIGLGFEPMITYDGDGTVVTKSAITSHLNKEHYYLNLRRYNSDHLRNSSHAFIFEIEELNKFIKNIITEKTHEFKYLSLDKPGQANLLERTEIVMYSPVAVHLTDGDGNHTGKILNPNSDLERYEEQIPNSYYAEFDEAKYIGGATENLNQLKLIGLGEGTFTLEIQKYSGDTLVATSTFVDVPVTEHLAGTMQLIGDVSVLNLDINNDGENDVVLQPSAETDPRVSLEILRKTIDLFETDPKKKKRLLHRIDKILASDQFKLKKLLKLYKKFPLRHIEQIIADMEKIDKREASRVV